jgi:hypothetical protein
MASREQKQSGCPYWSLPAMKCLVSHDGLFIPFDDHIEMFCTTSEYCHCLQYIGHTEKREQLLRRVIQEKINRRQHQRVQAEYRLSLTRRLSSSDRDSITLATTLDLSRGGMRIHTDMPLVGDALMQFCFDHSFPAEVPEGVGHVAWCHKEIDQAGYQAGITFQGNHIVEAIDAYLKEQQ